ncbi:MAG: hypothetical protein J6I50_00205 [Clostridia bacterium]|nr:hypothetical protein [Clostridia bacterium]
MVYCIHIQNAGEGREKKSMKVASFVISVTAMCCSIVALIFALVRHEH